MNTLITTLASLLYGVFLYWYVGSGAPVSENELQSAITKLSNSHHFKVEEFRLLKELDDGREFYMVNLIKWNDVAKYPEGSPFASEKDPHAANMRYAKFVIPELLKRGSLPVFQSKSIGKSLIRGVDDKIWDTVAVVRYRSFRDFLSLCEEIVASGVDEHKFAAIENTYVMPTRSVFVFGYIIPLAISLMFVVVTFTLSSIFC